MLADAVYHVLTEMGRSIPGDVTVVGNGGNADYYSTFGRQGLITIDYDYKQFGEELLNQLSLAGGQMTLSNFEPVYIKGELRAIEPGSTTSF
jgi:DNA-binding LacI/PurR family transcriptional regulator